MDKRLAKNIILSMGYNILTIIVPFITAPYLGRVLGAEKVGTYTFFQSVGTYFVMFGILGMRNYGNRMIARVRDSRAERSRVFCEIYAMQLFTGAAAALLYVLYVLRWSSNRPVSLIIGLYVLTGLLSVDWFCEGMEDFSSLAKRSVAIKFANLALIFAFVHGERDFIPYCLIMSGGYLASALLLWPKVFRNVDFILPDFRRSASHFRENFLLFVPAIASSIYQTMDKIMIGAVSSEAQLAYYEYADKIIQIPSLLFTAIGAVMLSRMSNVFRHDAGSAEKTIGMSMELSFMIGIAGAFGIFAVAGELVSVYYGSNFILSGPILMALSPTVILYGWSNVIRMQYIIPNNMDSVYIRSTVAGAAVNFVCNMIFIPRWQAVGATVGTIAAQITVTAVFTHAVAGKLPLRRYLRESLPLWGIGLAMLGTVRVCQVFHDADLPGLAADVLLGGAVYIVLLALYGSRAGDSLPGRMEAFLLKRFRAGRDKTSGR